MLQNPPDIGIDPARHVCKQAFNTPHLNVALVTRGLNDLGWNWEATTSETGLYVGIIGLPDPADEGSIIAWVEGQPFDLLPALLRATAMALESQWARL